MKYEVRAVYFNPGDENVESFTLDDPRAVLSAATSFGVYERMSASGLDAWVRDFSTLDEAQAWVDTLNHKGE